MAPETLPENVSGSKTVTYLTPLSFLAKLSGAGSKTKRLISKSKPVRLFPPPSEQGEHLDCRKERVIGLHTRGGTMSADETPEHRAELLELMATPDLLGHYRKRCGASLGYMFGFSSIVLFHPRASLPHFEYSWLAPQICSRRREKSF